MDLSSFPPIAFVIDLAYSGVTALADSLTPLTGTLATAAAIVLVTLLVRSILVPVGRSQVRAEIARRRIAPKLQELRRRYAKKPEVLQRKTMELYSQEKVSPFAGMLPTLLQAPVVGVVYALFILAIINGHPNGLLSETIAGVPLGTSLLAFLGGGAAWPGLAVYLVLLTVIGAVSWLSRVQARRFAPAPDPAASPAMRRAGDILSWMPFITVIVGAFVPLAATLYLAVTTAWTLSERAILRRMLGMRATIAPE